MPNKGAAVFTRVMFSLPATTVARSPAGMATMFPASEPRRCEHADEEDTEHGAEDESGDSEHDRNDSQIRVRHLRIGESAGDDDHEHSEEDREPARGLDVVRLALARNPPEVPVVRGGGRQSVERRGK